MVVVAQLGERRIVAPKVARAGLVSHPITIRGVMAYIYVITNSVNGKQYVGKTTKSVEKRFKEHLRSANRQSLAKRPLYSAIRKYGREHFYIQTLEETQYPEEREKYWICKLGTFSNGYNATMGGDGKSYVDYDMIIQLYGECHCQKIVAQKMHVDEGTVRKVLHEKHIPIVIVNHNCKKVIQYDKNHQAINEFVSCSDAARYLISALNLHAKIGTVTNKITDCANHTRKTAYGYIWEFI